MTSECGYIQHLVNNTYKTLGNKTNDNSDIIQHENKIICDIRMRIQHNTKSTTHTKHSEIKQDNSDIKQHWEKTKTRHYVTPGSAFNKLRRGIRRTNQSIR